jgi:hypothetical protein
MPEIESIVVHTLGGALVHDPLGKLMKMGTEASAEALIAQRLSKMDPMRKEKFEKATRLRLEEKKGWLAVRTSEFPAGDLEGAAKASLAIGCYKMEQGHFEQGREWMATALAEAPKDALLVRAFVQYNIEVVDEMLEKCSLTSTPRTSGRSSPV